MNLPLILDLIVEHESFRTAVYPDQYGNRTIGIGLNLDAEGAKALCALHGLNWAALANGVAFISYSDALTVATDQLMQAKFFACTMIPQFDALSDNRQAVLLDMIFNMGAKVFSTFHGTIACVNDEDFPAAADHMLASKWAKELPKRAEQDSAMMRAG